VTVVTGGASGIGAAVARRAIAAGDTVEVWDVNEPAEAGYAWTSVDLGDAAAVASAAAQVRRPVRLFAHCAGVNLRSSLDDPSAAANLDLSTRIHAGSFVAACQGLAPRLAEAGGCAVAVTSIADELVSPTSLAYGASKAALRRIVIQLAYELGPRGVRVNAVAPGAVRTPMTQAVWADEDRERRWMDAIPLGRRAEPDEIASVIEFLASPGATYVSGAVILVDGGLSAGVGALAMGG
jgi:NAD(P)-dependent dehydrogenase (short-subunit alcohol dehydrogenase family)